MKVLPCAFPPCHKRFSSRFTLRRHIDTFHHRIKRHHCVYCVKSFAYAHTLRQHVLKHNCTETCIPRLTDMLAIPSLQTPFIPPQLVYLPEIDSEKCGLSKPLTNIFE